MVGNPNEKPSNFIARDPKSDKQMPIYWKKNYPSSIQFCRKKNFSNSWKVYSCFTMSTISIRSLHKSMGPIVSIIMGQLRLAIIFIHTSSTLLQMMKMSGKTLHLNTLKAKLEATLTRLSWRWVLGAINPKRGDSKGYRSWEEVNLNT